jgi:hypothetical protein
MEQFLKRGIDHHISDMPRRFQKWQIAAMISTEDICTDLHSYRWMICTLANNAMQEFLKPGMLPATRRGDHSTSLISPRG